MAVSPIVSPSPSTATVSTTTAAKGKGLVVRNLVQDTAPSPSSAPQRECELAEQLNEEVRRKYVKGIKDSRTVISQISPC